MNTHTTTGHGATGAAHNESKSSRFRVGHNADYPVDKKAMEHEQRHEGAHKPTMGEKISGSVEAMGTSFLPPTCIVLTISRQGHFQPRKGRRG